MPCILKIRVLEARDLPIMDRSSELTDAYVEVKFADFSKKTEIRRKTLNPTFQEDFRIEVPNDSLLQDAPLELKVWDYDIVSSNDIIGVVYIDLNCLLMPESSVQIAGWFPIYDTLKGIRGELNVTVKLEFFGNVNEFKDASAGVQFFSSSGPFDCYQIEYIYGFVEELILDDDPEYDWVDNFRASRISNEERQLLLYHLSGKIRRQLGRKVLESGGNAVLAYWQEFDLEGESGIVARGYGTSAVIKKLTSSTSTSLNSSNNNNSSTTTSNSTSLAHSDFIQMHATSPKRTQFSRSDGLSGQTPPSPSISTLHLLEKDLSFVHSHASIPPIVVNKSISQEIPLLTLRSFAPLTIVKIGGVVMARSVKLLSSKASQQTRDNWWQELREEIQSHAKFLGCNAVVGYTENNTLERKEGLCVLSVCGTAVQLKITSASANTNDIQSSDSIDSNLTSSSSNSLKKKKKKKKQIGVKKRESCRCCHIPYKRKMAPFDMKFHRCSGCKKGFVPEIILSTIEPPQELQLTKKSMFFEARVCREKKKAQGEQNAIIVSENIPFIEYDLHRQLLYKLKLLGMNAAFAIKYQLAISESLIVGVATATAVFITALPHPPVLHINRNLESADKHLLSIQNKIEELSKLNHSKLVSSTESDFHHDIIGNEDSEEILTFKENEEEDNVDEQEEDFNEEDELSSSSSEEEDIHISSNNNNNLKNSEEFTEPSSYNEDNNNLNNSDKEIKESIEDDTSASSTYVVQVDDTIDEETISLLLEPKLPPQFNFCSTQTIPLGPNKRLSNIQFLTAIRRVELDVEPRKLNQHFSAIFHSLYSSIIFKLRSLTPCCICCVNVDVQLPNENEVQIIFTAMASLIVDDLTILHKQHLHASPSHSTSEPNLVEQSPNIRRGTSQDSALSNAFLEETPLPFVQITPMSFIPGTHLVKFIGRINIHLVKESFTVREQGNLAGFTHRFLNEINAIVKAHVASLGANALLSYKIEECSIKENQSKNQSYSLVSISGDAFLVMRNFGSSFAGLKKLVDVSKQ